MCSDRQKRILTDVWPSLKKGGILLYSTCTFNPAENEENVKWLTEKTHSESVRINFSICPGIEEILYGNISGYGFYPGRVRGDGFFISAVRKLEVSEESKSARKKYKHLADPSDLRTSRSLLKNSFNDIYRHDDTMFKLSLPIEEYFYLKSCLMIIKGGTAIYKTRKNGISPLHELAVSSQIKDDVFPVCDLDYRKAISYLRKENLTLENQPEGWILARYLGVNLGFVKNIGRRINNYLPVEWRIRQADSSLSDAGPILWI
jgi:NOL1/NOP2/fmu family ribosome biogenesis protein